MTRLRRSLLAPAGYLLLALAGHAEALTRLSATTPCACDDPPQTDWFLAWTPYALLHGRSPWTTSVLDVPHGVNLMWNTLLPLPGLLAAPVTLLSGPLAAHTLLSVFAFFSSATAMWWVCGRWVTWPWARFAAGVLYGFSPYLVAQGSGHLNLSLVALPVLLLAVLDELLVRQRRPAWLTGAGLGLVALAQLLTSEEVLASSFVVCLAGLAVLVVQHRDRVDLARLRHAAGGLLLGAAVLAAGAAWPLWVQFAGPQRVTAPVQDTRPYAADLLGPVVPTVLQALGTTTTRHWAVNPSENGSYLGLPLLLVLVAVAVRYRRLPLVRFAGGLLPVCWVLSLGTRLHVAGSRTAVPLPFALLARLPVLGNLSAVRFSLYVDLCAALLLAAGLDRWHGAGSLTRHRAVAASAAVLSLACLLPAWPYRFVPARVPAYFTTAGVDRIHPGSVVLTYPVPRFPRSAPMTWQAVAGFRYRSLGGYVITPRADGRGTFYGGVTTIERLLAANEGGRVLPPLTAARRAALLAELRRLGVAAVLVAQEERGAAGAQAYLATLLGRPPDSSDGGISAWYGLPG